MATPQGRVGCPGMTCWWVLIRRWRFQVEEEMREGQGQGHAVALAQSWPLIQEEVPKVPGTCRLVLNKVGAWLKLSAHSFEDCAANGPSPARPSPNPHSYYGPVTMNACLNLSLSVGLVASGVRRSARTHDSRPNRLAWRLCHSTIVDSRGGGVR